MHRCDRLLGPPVRYMPTRSGHTIPGLRLRVRPPGHAFGVEDGFHVDTGSDVAFGLKPQLRNWLRSVGARPGRDAVEWGPKVLCETYDLALLLEGAWTDFEAFFPTGPFLEENLVGRPVLERMPLCMRPSDRLLYVSRAH